MARRTPDARLESRESRSRLASRGKPHYRLLEPGLHIGYRRLKGRKGRPAVAGTWVARHYVGGRSYVVEKIGVADDSVSRRRKTRLARVWCSVRSVAPQKPPRSDVKA